MSQAAISAVSTETFPKLLLGHARVRANKVSIREKGLGIWQSWNWKEVADEVRWLACGLAARGFERGTNLAIIGDNRPRLYWSFAAAQSVGLVPVPLYQDSVTEEMFYVLDNAEIEVAIVEDQEQVDKLLELLPRCPRLKLIVYDDPRGTRVAELEATLEQRDRALALVDHGTHRFDVHLVALAVVHRPARLGLVLQHGIVVDRLGHLLQERRDAIDLRFGDEAAVQANDTSRPGGHEQHVATSQQVLGALLVDDRSRVDAL